MPPADTRHGDGATRNWAARRKLLTRELKSLPKPLAVFGYNDCVAADIIDACDDAGLLVPEAVAVMGVDNDLILCECVRVALSSVCHDLEGMAYQAAALLDRLMAGRKPPKEVIRVPPKGLVTRRSTDIVAVENLQVARALRYIQDQYASPLLGVDAIVAATDLSRRPLEKAFRQELNRTLNEEIVRVRMEKVKDLLTTTKMKVVEMTQEYSFIVPLMLVVIISTTISRLVQKSSVHVQHLEEQGYQINEGRETNVLRSIFIKDIDISPINTVHEKTKLPELVEKMFKSQSNSIYTVDDENQITGVISEVELRPIMTELENVKDFLVANHIANPNVTFALLDDDLDYVLRLFSKVNVDSIPVILSGEERKLLGAITRQEVLMIYNRETLKLNLAERLSSEIKTIGDSGSSKVSAGYSITEVMVSTDLVGKSLSELKIRSNYELEVLMIKHPNKLFDELQENELIISADPNYKLKWGDKLVVFGKDENIERFRKI